MKKTSIFAMLMLALTANFLGATVYYIDTKSGNDQNNGLSVTSPWKTIAKANSQLYPGDLVYLRGGVYTETIVPARSGTGAAVITYQRYASEDVTINNVSYGVLLDNKKYIVVDGLTIKNVGRFVAIHNGSQHNVIKNCRMEGASEWGGVDISESSYNKILDNFIYNGHGDVVELYPNADFNLIRGNEITGGPLNTHSCLLIRSTEAEDYSSYNIVQNNYIHGALDDNVNVLEKVDHNLIEGNVIESVAGGAGLKFCGGQDNIFRNNIVVDCKAYGVGLYTNLYGTYQSYGAHNVFYSNTVTRSDRGQDMDGGFRFVVYQDGGEIRDNIVKNNVFLNNSPQQIYVGAVAGFKDRVKNNTFSNNIIHSDDASHDVVRYMATAYSLTDVESMPETGFAKNKDADPGFVNPGNKDFKLRPDSPAIDGGAFLTVTASSGNGTQLKVRDAGYFSDGYGLIGGDLIQLEGQVLTAHVTDVDYANNTLTLDYSLSWYSGQGVSLSYSGFAPDIGVYEFSGASPLSASISANPTSGQAPLTVNFTGSASGGSAPHSYSWAFGDGSTSTTQNPSHTYSSIGNYTSTLTVTDAGSAKASATVTITVGSVNTASLFLSAETGSPAAGPGGTTDPSPGSYSFSIGAPVQLKSAPYEYYRFSKWSGDIAEADVFSSATTLTMNASRSVSATFCTRCADVNGDLQITPADAQLAFDIYLGKVADPTWCQLENADAKGDGTRLSPKVTPADAQTILNKYLKKSGTNFECSGSARAATVSTQNLNLPPVSLTVNTMALASGQDIYVPVIIDSPAALNAFGFDLAFPSDALTFLGLESTELTKDFVLVDANVMPYTQALMPLSQAPDEVTQYGLLRVGGYKTEDTIHPSSGVLVTLIFRVTGDVKERYPLTFVGTYDDVQNASIRNGAMNVQIDPQGREEERAIDSLRRNLHGKK